MALVHRTPDHRFSNLPDYPFRPHYYTTREGLRIHYVDEGPIDATPVLMMHGEPSWSYLYRHMIGPVVEAGYRVLAPDLVGFGKSDKLTKKSEYSYALHVAWMRDWLTAQRLENIVLVCQDWGSLVGLRLVADLPEKFAAVVLSNGGLPAGETPPPAFDKWRRFSRYSPVFPIGRIVQRATMRELSKAEVAAYDAPFPTRASKAGARIFPSLVPLGDNEAVPDQERAWKKLATFDKPFTCAFSDKDPITRGGDAKFRQEVPGARDNPLHRTLTGHHFIQEDDSEEFVAAILDTARRAGV
ncbi:haloalkane dehalogenase [Alteriqipengyuania lutimaris]|uniref:Alpha/beta fold hydrolase n=1 Tax=Alteriqipengyuania lutimaris TaxID=1538146 RepID=A0A395LMM2_9SPHN|nr:haloalkane dehalogenase [Alteriqipengyuania lutimaris]MBB3032767.1 haloalkane dehalogenase [Alteriqipengyuania lutimaris]RDS78131.1 alpha/beta fold hydrolase [Alteriqipengyuania lutimaris]